MGILIDTVRIANYRAIKNLEVKLSEITLLVGANNAGKTSFLKALHLALGIDRRGVTKEDFHDDGATNPDDLEIIIDVRIVSVDENNKRIKDFSDEWSESDGISGSVKYDDDEYSFVAFRTRYSFDILAQDYKREIKELKLWGEFENWQDIASIGKNYNKAQSIPLIFMDAQRDIQNDIKDRSSYLGKLTNKPDVDEEQVDELEQELYDLNEKIVTNSAALTHLKVKLKKLNSTVNSRGDGVDISPINKNIRDIGRNLNINFKDTNAESFPLENHGMGTRSWASLLTLTAYISWMESKVNLYFPILALEEPESHLHPNAQRQLFQQLKAIKGQKIISTHSPFVAAQSKLTDLRHFYKNENGLKVGEILICDNEEQKIKELLKEIDDSGNSSEIKRELCPQIQELKKIKRGKLNSDESRRIEREVMNTRGEFLFAKAIVLFEGETEEQALPVLAKDKFGQYAFEMGLNFIGVGGKDKYGPFLSTAKALNIPWYILSDGDGGTENDVKNQISKNVGRTFHDKLFVLDTFDFEVYLVENNYSEELINAINLTEKNPAFFPECYIEKYNDQNGRNNVTRNYRDDIDGGQKRALIDCLHSEKTKYAPAIVDQIVSNKDDSGKCRMPPVIDTLFNQIAKDLKIELS
jgi:putative ATP-dependent endonuclease of OLD family